MRRVFLFLLVLWPVPAVACLNDRDSDSLAKQAQGLPDVLRVVTGRFERNPALFYEMRIERATREVAQTPRDFALYDDLAVASDRIGKTDDGLRWMAKKAAVLPPFDAKNAALKEAWYRYFANVGTLHAHHWLKTRDFKNLGEMKLGREQIKRAIQIKPNAHFGREKYQLLAMEWILSLPKAKEPKTLAGFMAEREKWNDNFTELGEALPQHKSGVRGLSGLIVLGAAWESPDVFHTLAHALETKEGITLRQMALLRCQELLKAGKKPLGQLDTQKINGQLKDSYLGEMSGIAVNERNQKSLAELFPTLRAEADVESARRANWMNARLETGRHPDTDATFWNEWKPAAPPSLDVAWFNEKSGLYEGQNAPRDGRDYAAGLTILLGALAFSLVTLRFFKGGKRRREIA